MAKPNTSTHRLVIEAIHKNWHDGRPFAIWELRNASHCSTSSVSRVIKHLVKIKMVLHTNKGFNGRHYRVDVRWPGTAKQAIANYVWARMVKI